MDIPIYVRKHKHKLFALLFSALIAYSVFYKQASPAIEAQDPQSGIAVFFALIKSVFLFVFLSLSICKCLSARQSGNNIKALTYMVVTIALVGLAGYSMFNSAATYSATVNALE